MPTLASATAAAQQLLNAATLARLADAAEDAYTLLDWVEQSHKQLSEQHALQMFESSAQAMVSVLQLLSNRAKLQAATPAAVEDASLTASVTVIATMLCWQLVSGELQDDQDSNPRVHQQAQLIVQMTGEH